VFTKSLTLFEVTICDLKLFLNLSHKGAQRRKLIIKLISLGRAGDLTSHRLFCLRSQFVTSKVSINLTQVVLISLYPHAKTESPQLVLVVLDTINNSVSSDDDLANRFIVKFWHDTTSLRKLGQAPGMFNQEFAKAQTAVWIVD